jgi:hypothetical protein
VPIRNRVPSEASADPNPSSLNGVGFDNVAIGFVPLRLNAETLPGPPVASMKHVSNAKWGAPTTKVDVPAAIVSPKNSNDSSAAGFG